MITQKWLRLVRERLNECEITAEFSLSEMLVIDKFLKPILDYGEEEERGINEHFKDVSTLRNIHDESNKNQTV